MTSNMGYELVPITKIKCASCKHFQKLKFYSLKKTPSESANPIIAICTQHRDFLRAHEWVEFAKNCKEYEPK